MDAQRPSPLQNRVTAEGEIIATPERGLFMGNRGGRLHRPDKTLTGRRWTSRAWIICALQYKNWREPIFAPNRYTQLFFLDEATAFSAGHRPCALCRRANFLRFAELFSAHHGNGQRMRAEAIDRILHAERLTVERGKATYATTLASLPDGAMLRIDGTAHLWWQRRLWIWQLGGYRPSRAPIVTGAMVTVLTPPSIVAVDGYQPLIHPSIAVE